MQMNLRCNKSNDFFDMVITMMTLHEIYHTVRLKVLDEMIRVLKKDVRILVIDYHPSNLIFPKGWIHKTVIYFFETMAGPEHFKNFQDFMATNGIPGIVEDRNIDVEKSKIVSGGNLGMFVLRITENFSRTVFSSIETVAKNYMAYQLPL